ncbi:MAG: arylsulfotransferase family protein [Gammaproteobacteria bacterium]|jgi:outer membrane protein assembly factor BamB
MTRSPIFSVLVILALCFLAMIYGSGAVYMGWWPSKLVGDAKRAAEAILSVQDEEFRKNWPTSMEFIETSGRNKLSTINHAPVLTENNELIFVDGGTQQLRQYCPDNGCVAWLMDRSGNIKHVWHIGPSLIWEGAEHIAGFSRAENIYSVGAHPYSNGDLLVAYQGRNTYPYGVGIAKFDKDSNLLWRKDNFAHHWFSVDSDGRIYVPVFSALKAPVQIGDSNLQIDCPGGTLYEDAIAILDPDGHEINRISILDSLARSDLKGIVFQAIHSDRPLPLNYTECDPTHLNDVQVISAAAAANSPYLSPGDLLISLRSTNSVAVINQESGEVTWSSSGTTVLQHSPRYMGDNTVLIFDNLGGAATQGGSRLIRLDMSSGKTEVVAPIPGDQNAGDFLSATAGHIDVSDDNSRALVSLTRQGRTLEIDLANGAVLWEFLNIHDVSDVIKPDKEGEKVAARFATQTVRYFNNADFEFNEGGASPRNQ